MPKSQIPGFREVPRTGVIYVMHRAAEAGYEAHNENWVNLGQGAPQTDALPGAPSRLTQIQINPNEYEYSPITGQKILRQKVADLYNHLYRKNKSSQYTWENVSISGGGRVALTRLVASLGNINMGHFLPDYTAYEELLSIFKAFIPIPILLEGENQYQISIENLKKEIAGRGLKAVLLSNPCNPIGQVIMDEALKGWVDAARNYRCSFIFDEFYSHFIYDSIQSELPKTISAAEYVEEVDSDPIIIIDGLTKNWRYPGLRLSWTIGPKEVIHAIASAGSFLDGGANHPIQKEIIRLLDVESVKKETLSLQKCFKEKRDYALARLEKMGIGVEVMPKGAFYIWANLANLSEPINDSIQFFEAGLKEQVITVPGIFFDVNPEKRRTYARYRQYCRISFGPDMPTLKRGLDAIERVILKAQQKNQTTPVINEISAIP